MFLLYKYEVASKEKTPSKMYRESALKRAKTLTPKKNECFERITYSLLPLALGRKVNLHTE